MPRLPQSFIRKAWNIDPLLTILLRECRSLPSAQNELRWIREHLTSTEGERRYQSRINKSLVTLCRKRSKGVPLQYLLGSQPFGDLDILCQPGVLIPRSETEAYTYHLAKVIRQHPGLKARSKLNIIDLCTGTGAIPLLLHTLLASHFSKLDILGVDISHKALRLANDSLKHNIDLLSSPYLGKIRFTHADVLDVPSIDALNKHIEEPWDIVVSNPPYISKKSYWTDTSRSARLYEPALALVPFSNQLVISTYLQPEDVFYPAILNAAMVNKSRIALMEVADMGQALRVARYAVSKGHFRTVEIWRDWPEGSEVENIEEDLSDGTRFKVDIYGSGHGRSVVCKL